MVEEKKEPVAISRKHVAGFHESITAKRYYPSLKNFSNFLRTGIRDRDDDTFARISRSLSSASLSQNTSDLETQLVSLWAAFEALLPPPSREDREKARIVHFVDLITPAVSKGYLRGKFRIMYSRCEHELGERFSQIVSDHGVGRTNGEKLARLLIGDKVYQSMLLGAASSSPLICNRLAYLHNLLQNPTRTISKIEKHEKRVRWQIHRIYRERNSIVHLGRRSDIVGVLVENAHLYYRLVLRGLEEVNVRTEIHRPNGALALLAAERQKKLERLKQIAQNKKNSADFLVQLKFVQAVFDT